MVDQILNTVLPPYAAKGVLREADPLFDEMDYPDIKYHDLVGKRAIVTGASSGIGRQICKKLLKYGCFVMMVGRRVELMKQLADDPTSKGTAKVFQCNLSNPQELKETFRQIIEELEGKLDILINAAGTIQSKDFQETNLLDYDKIMNVNTRAPMHLMSMAVPFLRDSRGCVVNISASPIPRPSNTLFCVTKACLDMLTQCAALELAGFGVRVNGVAPGFTNTQLRMHQVGPSISQMQNEYVLKEAAKHIPLKKVNQAKDVADAVVWLCSEQSSFINGQIINIDGGASLATTTQNITWGEESAPRLSK